MADTDTVCSLCGDIGFPDKLFECTRCCVRIQHSYCSSYYNEDPSATGGVCDWCLSKERSRNQQYQPSCEKHVGRDSVSGNTGGDKVNRSGHQDASGSRGKSSGGSTSSPKHAGRRYKLLKDVLC